jgi:hypothetical protein
MKRVMGCAVFVGLLAVAGVVFLKYTQDKAILEPTFREDTVRGVCERFVKAMAEGDLTTMQEFAHPDLEDECQDLIDRFPTRVKGDIESYHASFVKDWRDRVRIRVIATTGSYDFILWVRSVDGRPLVSECQF